MLIHGFVDVSSCGWLVSSYPEFATNRFLLPHIQIWAPRAVMHSVYSFTRLLLDYYLLPE